MSFKRYLIVLSAALILFLVASPAYSTTTTSSKADIIPNAVENGLVRSHSDSSVYLINNGKKFPISSMGVYNDFSALGPLRFVDQNYLDSFELGNPLTRVIGSTVNSDVYLIIAGIKLLFPSCELVEDYGATCTDLLKLSPEQLTRFVNGPAATGFLRSTSNATVYFIEDGKKRPIASWGDLLGMGVPFVINWLTDSYINSIPTGELMLASGGLIKTPNSGTVYAINEWSGTKSAFPVTSFNDTVDLGLGTDVRTVSSSHLSEFAKLTNLRSTLRCGSTTYAGSNGIMYKVLPSDYQTFNLTSDSFIDGGSICNRLTFSQVSLTKFVSNRGSIYIVEDGVKRGFSSYAAYLEHGGNPGTTVPVSNFIVDNLSSGAPIHASIPRGEAAIVNDIYNRVNAERAARGLSPLGWDNYLNNSARSWSVQMANSNSFKHSNLLPHLSRFYVVAENIGLGGAGTKSGAIHKAWMNSEGHRINLLARNLDVIGIGAYCAPDGRLWITQQFGRWPNSALPATFGPVPNLNPIVMNDGGGAIC